MTSLHFTHARAPGRRFRCLPVLLAVLGCNSAEETPLGAVGPGEGGRVVLPVNQVLTPAGIQVELSGLRPQAVALSPDGRLLVASGKTSEVVLVDPESGKILDR